MRAPALVAVLVTALTLLGPASAPAQIPAPDLSGAAAAILIDTRDGKVMLAKNPGVRRAMASTTKLMTALLVLERAELTDVLPASGYQALPIESQIGLRAGERLTVADLLEGLLLESANDAAVTLAEGVAGSRAEFVAAMNERAAQLGLDDTSYGNEIGLDDAATFSTARDLADLARRLLRDRVFARIVDLPSAVLESGSRERVVANRNSLVSQYSFVDGVKTGRTTNAGYVLIGAARGRLGAQVVSVVMGEASEAARDADTLALLRYGLSRFRRKQALDAERPVAEAAVAYRDERIDLVPAQDLVVVARRGERVRTRVEAPDELDGELAAGSPVGSVAVLRGGRVIEREELLTAAEVPGAGPLRRLSSAVGGALTLVLLVGMVTLGLLTGIRSRGRRRARERDDRRRARGREPAIEDPSEPAANP